MTRGSAGLDHAPAGSHDSQTIPAVPRTNRGLSDRPSHGERAISSASRL